MLMIYNTTYMYYVKAINILQEVSCFIVHGKEGILTLCMEDSPR